jgi:N-acetylglutamate synthase-like GNAT family acetyltransferase
LLPLNIKKKSKFITNHSKGIGSALLQKILTEAEHLGINRLFAEVSTTAQKFFLANEFNVDEESNNVVCGQPARQYKMSRQKTPSN